MSKQANIKDSLWYEKEKEETSEGDLAFIFEKDEGNASPRRSMDESSQWHRGGAEGGNTPP